MISGIIEREQKSRGMRPEEFRNRADYESVHHHAREMASIMNTMPLIQKFRAMSEYVEKTYDREKLMGPTGHFYPINKTEWRRSFS